MTNEDEAGYEPTTRHAPFKGTLVSRKSVAQLITSIIDAPELHLQASLGVNKPNTDGDKPYVMQALGGQLARPRRPAKIAFAIGWLEKWRFSQIHP